MVDSGRLPRKLAAILYADVAGYSRLTGEDEDATHGRLSEYLSLVTVAIEQHQGTVMHYAGDAVLAMFKAVVDAVACSAQLQRDLRARNDDLPDERKLQFRVGINLGDVIEDRGDIYGDGVNVAARLESLAEPGGICISESVRTAIGNKLPFDYEFMGEQEVKNIAEPVRAYRVFSEPTSTTDTIPCVRPPQEMSDKPSVAVLAFETLGRESGLGNIATGLAEDIGTALSRFDTLFVVGRRASLPYAETPTDLQTIGRELGVKFLLTGSAEIHSDRLRVNAQLMDAATGQQIWAERYDRKTEDIFAVRDEITLNVISNLGVQLSRGKMDRLRRRETDSLEAWVSHNEGLSLLLRLNREDMHRAKELFRRAIEADPRFVSAYTNLGLAYYHEARRKWSIDPDASLTTATELATKAVEIDASNGYAHTLWVMIHTLRREYDKALAAGERSVALGPNAPANHAVYAVGLMFAGQLNKAVEHFDTAIRLIPCCPSWFLYERSHALVVAGRNREAVTGLRRFIAEDAQASNRANAHLLLALAYAGLDQDKEARAAVEKAVSLSVEHSLPEFCSAEELFQDQKSAQARVQRLNLLGRARV